jgi:Adenine-specific methyltransferase EcoRI
VLCNCDDPYESNFFRYFALNFNALGLKKLIATSYAKSSIVGGYLPLLDIEGLKPEGMEPYAIEISEVPDANGDGAIDLADVEYLLRHDANTCQPLKGDSEYGAGDFRSAECVEYLKQADVVVTNPPFSLFREYVAQLVEYQKSFVIVGSKNSVTTKEMFALIKSGNLWLGNGFAAGNAYFKIPKHNARDFAAGVYDDATGLVKFRNVGWFTNLDFKERHEQIPLYKPYSPDRYPEFDNYNAIEVSKTSDIPCDYDGIMGVPVTFLDMFKPEQFEIVGITKTWFGLASKKYPLQQQFSANGDVSEVSKLNDGAVIKLDHPPAGKTYYKVGEDVFIQTYPRILIRRK